MAAASELDRVCQRGRDAIGELERMLLADDPLAHERELVAAETGDGVAVAGDASSRGASARSSSSPPW